MHLHISKNYCTLCIDCLKWQCMWCYSWLSLGSIDSLARPVTLTVWKSPSQLSSKLILFNRLLLSCQKADLKQCRAKNTTVKSNRRGHCFMWRLSVATSCRLIYHINVSHPAACPYVQWSSSDKWQTMVVR